MDSISFFGSTNIGQVRTNNEDAFISQNIWDENHILAVAIDGVGGYEGGEIASSMAQELIVKYLELYPNGERLELLQQAVLYANNTIYTERKNNPQYSNMSCVLTAILIEVEKQQINMAHVGDTRLYQYVDEKIEKLSHDHSLIGYREEIGELTEEEAMKHPQRNIINKDIGSVYLENTANDYIEVATFPLQPQSTLLLCSDGLCDMVTSLQMKEVLQKNISVEEKVELLIKSANEAGGKDNVTVVIVEANFSSNNAIVPTQTIIEDADILDETDNDNVGQKSGSKKLKKGIIIVAITLIVIIAVYFIGRYVARSFFS